MTTEKTIDLFSLTGAALTALGTQYEAALRQTNAALGLEGQVWSPPDQADRLPVRLARWRDAGADAVGINSGRAGEPWSGEHLDALLRAADARPS